jgi:hypothetical protein
MGLSLLSQPAQALNWNFSYTLNDGGVFTGTYITDGSSPAATDTIYNVTGISGTIAKGGTTVSISGLDNSNWTVRSSRKINEFTRVSAPNVLHPSSRLTIAERLSMQGF